MFKELKVVRMVTEQTVSNVKDGGGYSLRVGTNA